MGWQSRGVRRPTRRRTPRAGHASDARREQIVFPKRPPAEIDRIRRFGEVKRYAAGEPLFVTGKIPGMFRSDLRFRPGDAARPVGAPGPDHRARTGRVRRRGGAVVQWAVGAVIGEGAAVVPQLHSFLADMQAAA
jgi:hypothetical protein